MKFQHTTSLAIQPGIQRQTISTTSGTSRTIIPGKDALYTVTIQEIVFSWTGVTSAGQINVSGQPSDPNPFIVYQNVGADNMVVPFLDTVYQLGTYGLQLTNNSTGGTYTVTVFFTQILP